MLVPSRLERLVMGGGIFDRVLDGRDNDAAVVTLKPLNQTVGIIEVLRQGKLLIGSELPDELFRIGPVNQYRGFWRATLTDDFTGEIKAVFIHSVNILNPNIGWGGLLADMPVCQRFIFSSRAG
jgi:hypothetical protein